MSSYDKEPVFSTSGTISEEGYYPIQSVFPSLKPCTGSLGVDREGVEPSKLRVLAKAAGDQATLFTEGIKCLLPLRSERRVCLSLASGPYVIKKPVSFGGQDHRVSSSDERMSLELDKLFPVI